MANLIPFPRRSSPHNNARQLLPRTMPSVRGSYALYLRSIEARLERRVDGLEGLCVVDGFLRDIDPQVIVHRLRRLAV